MKKLIYILVILLLFSSCTKTKDPEKTILFQHYFTGSLSSGIDDLTNVINSNQKDFTLISTPMEHEEFKISIRVQLDSKNPPDIFSYWAGAKTKYLLDNNKISPITSIFEEKVKKEIFDKSVLNACSYNNEIYMLPITRHYVGFFYNKKIFTNFQLEEPETLDDLLKISAILQENNITPLALGAKNRWPAQFWFDYILLRTAGYDYREKLMNNSASYTDYEVINAVKIWKMFLENKYFNSDKLNIDWDEAAIKVAKGEAAMTLMGTWIIPNLENEALIPDKDYGFFPFPIINSDIEMVSLGPIDGILLSKKGENIQDYNDVLYQFTKEKAQKSFNINSGAIAPHKDVEDSVYNSIQLEIKDLINKSKYWAFNYDLATTPLVSEAGLNFFVDFINKPEEYKELLNELQHSIE